MEEFDEFLEIQCRTYERLTSLRVAKDAEELIVFLANGYITQDPEAVAALELPSLRLRTRSGPGEVPIPRQERAEILADRLTLLPQWLMVASGIAEFRPLEFRDKFPRVKTPDGSRARVRWEEYLRKFDHKIAVLRRQHIIEFTRTWHAVLLGDICPPFKKSPHAGG